MPRRTLPAAVLLLALAAVLPVRAQTARPREPRQPPAPAAVQAEVRRAEAAAPGDDGPQDTRRRQEERDRADRGTEQAAPQAVGDAPLPPQGQPVANPVVNRGPLTIRRTELSLGFDHALSPRWVASGLVGVSRGRLHRFQTELPADALPGSPPTESDSTIRTRSTMLTGVLSYLPGGEWSYDAALSLMRTRFEVARLVNDAALFEGRNVGQAWSLSLNATRLLRQGPRLVVPQLGLEFTQAQVDPLVTEYHFVDDPATRFPGFTVGEQHSRSLAALAALQVQWPRSAGFGTWAPYARATLRQRLWMRADAIESTAPGADTLVTDARSVTPRTAGALAGGLQFQWPRGVGAFAELSVLRANGNVCETRFGSGLKLEF